MSVISKAAEDTLLSAIAEADRHVRDTPTAKIDRAYVRARLEEALALLGDSGVAITRLRTALPPEDLKLLYFRLGRAETDRVTPDERAGAIREARFALETVAMLAHNIKLTRKER